MTTEFVMANVNRFAPHQVTGFEMKAIVLCAGQGRRLRPVTTYRPKGMVPVGNRPILEHVVSALVAAGVDEVVMVVGHRSEEIMSHFGDGTDFGVPVTYVRQDRQLGTGHAVSVARDVVDDDFLVIAGDNIVDPLDIGRVMAAGGNAMLITLSEDPSKYGVVDLDGDRITRIVEKPMQEIGHQINTGVYRFERRVIDIVSRCSQGGRTALTSCLSDALDEIDLRAVRSEGVWIDAVYPWDLIEVNAVAIGSSGQRMMGIVEPNVTIKGDVSIGKGTRIRSGSYIEGPVVIGDACDIGPNVTIRGSTSIGDGVDIGPYTLISQCLIMDDVRMGSHSHISHSVVDGGVDIGPHLTSVSGTGTVRSGDEMFEVERVGSVIGSNTDIGSNVIISPGMTVGVECIVSDGSRVTRDIGDNSVVI